MPLLLILIELEKGVRKVSHASGIVLGKRLANELLVVDFCSLLRKAQASHSYANELLLFRSSIKASQQQFSSSMILKTIRSCI